MLRARASEFPNDNSLLHEGAVWICEQPCGPLETLLYEDADADADADAVDEGWLVEATIEPTPQSGQVAVSRVAVSRVAVSQAEPAPESEPVATSLGEPALESGPVATSLGEPAPESGPVATSRAERATATPTPSPSDPFSAFVQTLVSIAIGQGAERAAAALPDLLERGCMSSDALESEGRSALLAVGLVTETDSGFAASEELAALTKAWRDVLCGAGDFSACGKSTLNEWAADVLAAVLGAPERAEALRYELRRHGVAAFGMLRLAA